MRVARFSQIDDRLDAVVIGGGPAGAVSATLLARRGWRTLLVDRGPRGRPTCCGRCLNPRIGPLLDRLGLRDAVESATIGRSRSVRVHMARGRTLDLPFRSARGWLTPRARLDAALLDEAERAGATVLHGVRATVEPDRAHESRPWRVRLRDDRGADSIRAALLVGADGLGSAVARASGLAGSSRAGRAYGFCFTVGDGFADRFTKRGAVEMFVSGAGYLGVGLSDDGSGHAAALVRSRRGDERCSPTEFLESLAVDHPLLGGVADRIEEMRAAGPMPWRPARVSAAGVALVGDAAGYVEPFTGEGMAWAIESASLLADSVAESRRFGVREARRYARAWSAAMRSSHRRCRAVAWALRRPALVARMSRVAGVESALARGVVARVIRAEAVT